MSYNELDNIEEGGGEFYNIPLNIIPPRHMTFHIRHIEGGGENIPLNILPPRHFTSLQDLE